MNYKISKNKIIIFGKEDFNPQHILECGQIFCYYKDGDDFVVESLDKKAKIKETNLGFEILTSDTGYFVEFFDLKTDYSLIKKRLLQFEIMRNPIEFGKGIRILKNDAFEVLISFIISANNNIKRIQKSLFAIKKHFNSNSFPKLEQLLTLTEKDFYGFGLGYRSSQMVKALKQLKGENLQSWSDLPTDEIRKKLISLSGVGPKVADCVLLFGFSRKDVFPVDTWIYKMYNMFYPKLENREKIRENLLKIFGEDSGYAQQYLFYYQRSFLKK